MLRHNVAQAHRSGVARRVAGHARPTGARIRGVHNLLVRNVGRVTTAKASDGQVVHRENVDILVKNGVVAEIGPEISTSSNVDTVDALGGLVTPGFVDPHTHLFPTVDRADEFAMRPVKSYQEIAAAGGGILSTVREMRGATEDQLFERNRELLQQMFEQGTTCVEIKSGYGLDTASELRALAVIDRLRTEFADRMTIVPTFMGAHAVPPEFKGRTDAYVDLIVSEMLPAVAEQGVAEYCDVFCENGYFDAAQSRRVLEAAGRHGMKLRLHADEFADSGGAALAAELGAHSADHLMAVSGAGIKAMADGWTGGKRGVVPTMLPGTTLFLGKGQGFAPAREMLDAGLPVALATDFNPGSSVYQSQALMMQLAMTQGRMSVEEAFAGVTRNAALAVDRQNTLGTVSVGSAADFVLWDYASIQQIPYYGVESRNAIAHIVKAGRPFHMRASSMEASARRGRAFAARPSAERGSGTKVESSPASSSAGEPHSGDGQDLAGVLHALTDFVDVDAQGRITRLPEDFEDVVPKDSVDRAPGRTHRLNEEEQKLAVENALKYFAPNLHGRVRPALEAELNTYGHIYAYGVMPRTWLFAVPTPELPGRTEAGRAMVHMILNNLDPRVAQFPQELITYGGNGAVFGNWAQFHITVRMLLRMTERQSLSVNSGHPAGLFPVVPGTMAPAAVISNGNMVSHYSTDEHFDRLYALGVSMYGQMTAGSWMYIGPQGIVHGTTLTLAGASELANTVGKSETEAAALRAANAGPPLPITDDGAGSCGGQIFVTSGLGGMSGAQPKAATINGGVCMVAEMNEKAMRKRHEQGWLDTWSADLNEVVDRAAEAARTRTPLSVGYLGNVVDLWEHLAGMEGGPVIATGSDQTSLHNPYNGGYYPAGLSFADAQREMVQAPDTFRDRVHDSLKRHMSAMLRVQERDGTFLFDYGNSFLRQCTDAGAPVPAHLQSYVACILGPQHFDYGFGPYRWVCTSGDPADLAATDDIASGVLREQLSEGVAEISPQLRANLRWVREARANKMVVGSQARILYADALGRVECAVRMNRAVRDGHIKAPVVIGRDHHDVSGTDSPWRETSNIHDGSNLTADMAVQNVIGDAARGATWVSLHNGGGTGWGQAVNGGFGLVLDGSHDAELRARSMVFFDVANGLVRRARAGNPHAQSTIQRLARVVPDFEPFLPSTAQPL